MRAKFKVETIEKLTHEFGEQHKLRAAPVSGGSEENEAFWSATPGGVLELDLVKPEALEAFPPGTEFYVDLTPIPKEPGC